MKLLIEEHRYPFDLVKELFPNIDELDVVDGVASINYVGYFYHAERQECVFVLPKVILDQNNKVFGKYEPEKIVDLTKSNPLSANESKFIYGLSVWIYRAISVYLSNCIAQGKDHTIVRHQKLIKVGRGRRRLSNTFLDILLALLDFNRQNQDWFMFILKNAHSGFNKINWSKTITSSQAIVQDGEPVYINPVTKKRYINFDEELLVIFYSILNYLREYYGFPVSLNVNYELITGKRFDRYLNKGFGVRRLRQIKYKYFSDKALQLWELCFAFFEQSKQVRMNSQVNEFLLVKNFNIVFEAIIDELVGDNSFPDRLNKKQNDGKEVDHMFLWNSLTTVEPDKQVYYIGDSKYYKQKNEVGPTSIAKQYTYARNVIQWNLNLFFGESDEKPKETDFCLRDELTEGYNVIPNFFISATIPDDLRYDDNIDETKRSAKTHVSRQFKNRLFDRDTLLITHYDVNFLYVVSLYARNNAIQKKNWKQKVRNIFRDKIRDELANRYNFFAMRAKPSVDAREYIETHFRDVLGKVFAPYDDKGIIALALDNREEFEQENQALLAQLEDSFNIVRCGLSEDPRPKLPKPVAVLGGAKSAKRGVLMVMMENYATRSKNFAESGKVAVGIKYHGRGMEIINNLSSIGYVLFHTWDKTKQKMFAIVDDCKILAKTTVPEEYYMSPKNPTHSDGTPDLAQFLYVLLTADMSTPIDTAHVDCNKKKYTDKTQRYDAQFAWIDELVNEE
ncbi:MAG: LlaJI family restriction endonuclease [Bacteroidales bacterium]|nr:LlaJI family restriction endonuclease [Bacteroidales bacterium]